MARYDSGAPTNNIVAVTPSDTVEILSETECEYLRVGTPGTGTLTVVFKDGTTYQFINVQAGERLEVQCVRVNATGTNASNITAYFRPKAMQFNA